MYRFLLVAVLLGWKISHSHCCAQGLPLPRFEMLGVNEGLSQSTVTAIYQDRQGFIWIGTGDGLNRFDGQAVQRFWVATAKGAPPASYVRSKIWEDYGGNIWFANEKGLHGYVRGHKKIQTVLTTNQWQDYTLMKITGSGLWAWHSGKGVLQYDFQKHKIRYFPLPDSLHAVDSRYYCGLSEGPGNKFWTKRSRNGPFYFFNPETTAWEKGSKPTAATIICFGQGHHFMPDADGLIDYDSATRTARRVAIPFEEAEPNPQRILTDRWGRVWVATAANGLYCYQPATGALTAYRHNSIQPASLPTDLTSVLFIDRADNLWVGTDGGGAARLDLKPPRFGLFPMHESDFPEIKGFFVRCFYEDSTEKVWFGIHADGIGIMNRHTGRLEKVIRNGEHGKRLQVVNAIVPDGDGKLWIGHASGFSLFDPESQRFTDLYRNPVPASTVPQSYGIDILPLQDGRMLTASRQGLMLFRRWKEGWTGRSFAADARLTSFTSNLCQMPNGSIWAAVNGQGLLHLRCVGDSLLVERQYFAGLQVRGLHCDSQIPEILWAGTTSGLARLNTRTGSAVFKGTDEGMSNAYVYGLLEDNRHRLWLSTNGGLICYDPKKEQFVTYTHADGLQSNEFNSGAFYKGPSGTLYFGGIHGFNWIKPGADTAAGPPPQVALSSLLVNGQRQLAYPRRPLELSHNQNDLSFQMAVLDYTRPKANKLSCFLEGWDSGWMTQDGPEAHYANLPPGHYKLHIRGRNAAGLWSEDLTFPIHIRAPFWKTPLFYTGLGVLLVLMLASLLYAAFRRKLQQQQRIIAQQKALMEERARISRDMHDEIGSGLTRIAMMTEMLNLREGKIPEMKNIAQAARGLVQNVGEIVWALHPDNDRLDSLLAYLREQIHAFMEPYALDYEILFPETIPEYRLSNGQRRNLYLTVREAVNNALKHAGASRLSIIATVDDQKLQFRVCDNGRGFAPAPVRTGANGLRNMRRRMSDIGGYFEHTSVPGNTCIFFGIPLGEGDCKPRKRRLATTFFTRTYQTGKSIFGK